MENDEGCKYKNPVCRGSYALGSACGSCERCAEERLRLSRAYKSPTEESQALAYPTLRPHEEHFSRKVAHLKPFGYAHGHYLNFCCETDCATQNPLGNRRGSFIGDKRAHRCYTCAQKIHDEMYGLS